MAKKLLQRSAKRMGGLGSSHHRPRGFQGHWGGGALSKANDAGEGTEGARECVCTRFPFIQTFLSYQVGKSGLVIPRMVLMAGEVEEGFRRKGFHFFFKG